MSLDNSVKWNRLDIVLGSHAGWPSLTKRIMNEDLQRSLPTLAILDSVRSYTTKCFYKSDTYVLRQLGVFAFNIQFGRCCLYLGFTGKDSVNWPEIYFIFPDQLSNWFWAKVSFVQVLTCMHFWYIWKLALISSMPIIIPCLVRLMSYFILTLRKCLQKCLS